MDELEKPEGSKKESWSSIGSGMNFCVVQFLSSLLWLQAYELDRIDGFESSKDKKENIWSDNGDPI